MKKEKEEFEHISKPIERVMQRVWEKYEKKNGPVSDNLKLLAEAALAMGVEK